MGYVNEKTLEKLKRYMIFLPHMVAILKLKMTGS